MKTKLYINTISALVFAALVAACSSASKDKPSQLADLKAEQAKIAKQISALEAEIAKENPEKVAVKTKDVAVAALQPRQFDHFVQTQGKVESEDNIQVSAKSMGVITKVYVKEGENVKTGQVMAQIDNGVIIRSIEEVKSQLDLAKNVFERQKNLWDQKIGTEVQYLQAKTNKESLEKRLSSLNEQNEMTRIKSPISGIVDEVYVKLGQNISPGMPAVRVVNFSDLKLVAEVSESYATNINKGDKAIVVLPDLDGKEIQSKVTFASRTINSLSRTFTVEVKLPSNGNLRPNMTASVKFIFKTVPSALVVPINVVQDINGEKVVYIAEESGDHMVARKKVVTVDGVYDNLAQVQGLQSGDKIITVGYQGLNDGEFVKI